MYYAVKKGSKTGIFESWDECKQYVTGYSGALFKKFENKEDAEIFLSDVCSSNTTLNNDMTGLHSYIDGSFSQESNEAGYGIVFIFNGKIIHTISGKTKKYINMRNVAGEIAAAGAAVKWALDNGYKTITLHHDYTGTAYWATGHWKRNNEGTINYKKYMDSVADKIDIKFIKVKGHSGDTYNDLADKLAKEGINIIDKLK